MAEKGMSRRKHALAPCEVLQGKETPHETHIPSRKSGFSGTHLRTKMFLEKTKSVLTHQKGNSKITRILEATSLSLVLPNMTRFVLGCEDAGKGRSHLLLRMRFQLEQFWNSACDSLQVSVGRRSVGWSQRKTGSNSQGASLFIHQEKDKLWRCKGKGPIFVSFENPDKSVGVFPRKQMTYT